MCFLPNWDDLVGTNILAQGFSWIQYKLRSLHVHVAYISKKYNFLNLAQNFLNLQVYSQKTLTS